MIRAVSKKGKKLKEDGHDGARTHDFNIISVTL